LKVKICGITSLDDAMAAAAAGADYLGFIFYPASKRHVEVGAVRQIVAQLRAETDHATPTLVGVFVNESGPMMSQVLQECQLDLAQLSGDELPSLVGDRNSPVFGRCYKALRPTSLAEAEAEVEWFLPPASTRPSLLLDTYHPTLPGGTGATGDWSISAELAESVPGLMLAGGLTIANVADAVRQVRPFAVDVASGVEASPGKKDHELVQTFIHRAKLAASGP
jgi:phosphoribosylanthranilate isomerase